MPRATLAILVATLMLNAEFLQFFGTQNKDVILYHGSFQTSVGTTNQHGKSNGIMADFCTPKKFETERARMTAVFAFCNFVKTDGSPNRKISFSNSDYSQSVSTGGKRSRTIFSILVADHKEHLVLRYNATKGLVASAEKEVLAYVRRTGGCNATLAGAGEYELAGCKIGFVPDVTVLMNIVLQYTEIDTRSRASPGLILVGHEAGNNIAMETTPLEVGVVQVKKMTVVGVFVVSVTLFIAALAVYLCIENHATVVIAAILRKETGQDLLVPAVSMAACDAYFEFDANEKTIT